MVFVVLLGIGMMGAGAIGFGQGRRIAGSLAILGALIPWVLYPLAQTAGTCAGDTSGFCMAYLVGVPSMLALVVGGIAAIVCLVPKQGRRSSYNSRQIWGGR